MEINTTAIVDALEEEYARSKEIEQKLKEALKQGKDIDSIRYKLRNVLFEQMRILDYITRNGGSITRLFNLQTPSNTYSS